MKSSSPRAIPEPPTRRPPAGLVVGDPNAVMKAVSAQHGVLLAAAPAENARRKALASLPRWRGVDRLTGQHRRSGFSSQAQAQVWLEAAAELMLTRLAGCAAPARSADQTIQPADSGDNPGGSSDREHDAETVAQLAWDAGLWLREWGEPESVPPGGPSNPGLAHLVAELSTPGSVDPLHLPIGAGAAETRRFFDAADRALGGLFVARLGNSDCPTLHKICETWDHAFDLDFRRRVLAHIDSCESCQRRRLILLGPPGQPSSLSLVGMHLRLPSLSRRSRPVGRRIVRWAIIVAALLLMAVITRAVAMDVDQRPTIGQTVDRGGDPDSATPGPWPVDGSPYRPAEPAWSGTGAGSGTGAERGTGTGSGTGSGTGTERGTDPDYTDPDYTDPERGTDPDYTDTERDTDPERGTDPDYTDTERGTDPDYTGTERGTDPDYTGTERGTHPDYTDTDYTDPDYTDPASDNW